MKKRPFTSSFDELIKKRYGASSPEATSDISSSAERLFNSYYGAPAAKARNCRAKSTVALSLSYDNGETLRQERSEEQFEEYVVQYSIPEDEFEEYVVGPAALFTESSLSVEGSLSTQSSAGEKLGAIPTEDADPTQECQVEIFPPPRKSNIPGAKAAPAGSPSGETARPQERPADRKPLDSSAAQSAFSDESASTAKPSDDDFIADMQSILSGQMVYDPNQKKTVKKDELGQQPQQQQPQASRQNGDGNEPPAPDAKNSQAIFDRIAQSMQYANAYDLGTMELENRFSDFDKISELEKKAAKEKKAKPPAKSASPVSVEPPAVPTVDSADFIRDLDAIRQKSAASTASAKTATAASMSLFDGSKGRDAACVPWGLSLSSAVGPSDYSRPLYETGEHVRTGWDLYTDQLRVGRSPGVLFSYGELISMGDLYRSVSDMMAADASELQQIKTLIQRSTAHFSGKSVPDVTDGEWEKATNEHYLKLAEDNYHHFAPDLLFNQEVWAKNVGKHLNNKSAWEAHHQWAIEEALKMYRLPENANRSFFLEWPLIINGFGDHFLTDAFSAGHVVNKEAIIEYYKHNFYNGKDLKPEAEDFFGIVANLAFKGDVQKKFSMLRTCEPYALWIKPNIDSASAFKSVLVGIAKKAPDEVGNLAVIALHDRLNKDGIEVYNEAGDGTWKLTGDNTLNDFNLRIIQRAVQQSVDNINDPAINAPGLNLQEYFDKVWKHVPKLTAASVEKVKSLAVDYTSPTSEILMQTAADLINRKLDLLIKKIIDRNELEYDPEKLKAK